jgi:hypothetical protein
MVAVGAFVALVIGAGVVLVVTRDDDSGTADAPEQLLLEPIGTTGEDPFTASVAIEEVAVLTAVSSPSGDRGEPLTVAGSQPGLYGGTQDETACDAATLVAFLEENPDKGAAWAGVLGIDTNGIRDYVSRLTPVLLRTDTRVTNHGFANGVATPRQSVLQAGTAVMVDSFGVPRVRCSCGNPLTEPAPLDTQLPAAADSGNIVLVGQPWQSWNPATVVIVDATIEVDEFTILDVETEQEYTQPVGSDVDAPTGGKVIVLADAVGLGDDTGAVIEEFPFGTPITEARDRITDAIGDPTGETPRGTGPDDYCSFDSIHWGELTLFHHNGALIRWSVDTSTIDPQTSESVPREVLGIVQTETGITLLSTPQDVRAAYPTARETLVNRGRLTAYLVPDPDGRSFVFDSRTGMTHMGAKDDC